MKIRIFILLLLVALAQPLAANAADISLINRGDNWNYSFLPNDPFNSSTWGSISTAKFDSTFKSVEQWNQGNAPFNGGYDNTPSIQWPLPAYDWKTHSYQKYTDLIVYKDLDLLTPLNSLTINYAVDDHFALFVNGTMLAKTDGIEGRSYWNDKITITDASLLSAFKSGTNRITLFVSDDNRTQAYFDMEASGTPAPAPNPEPSSMILGFMSLAGALGLKKRKSVK